MRKTFGGLPIGAVFTLPNRKHIGDGFSNPMGLSTWYTKISETTASLCGDHYLVDSVEEVKEASNVE